MVTSPACGIPAAPMLAAVAVMLQEQNKAEKHVIGMRNASADQLACRSMIRVVEVSRKLKCFGVCHHYELVMNLICLNESSVQLDF